MSNYNGVQEELSMVDLGIKLRDTVDEQWQIFK